jgi:hypothetical protein
MSLANNRRGPSAPLKLGREAALAGLVFLAVLYLCRSFHDLSAYSSTPLLDPAGILQVYPWHHFNMEQFRSGHFPLWNPYSALGEPHLANIQTAVFFPLYWAWYAIGGTAAYGVMLLIRLWLAAMFWFIFARARICSFTGALIVGSAYAFGGYGLWFVQLVDLNSQMLLPLALLALPELALKPRISNFSASAALIALIIIGGHPEAAFVTLFVASLFTLTALLVERQRPAPALNPQRGADALIRVIHRVLLLAAAAVTGLLLSSITSLPFLNYLSRCWTMHGAGFGFFHLDPRGIFTLFIPFIHYVFKGMPREIPVQYINFGSLEMLRLSYKASGVPGNLPGCGIVVSLLAFYSLLRLRRQSWPVLFFSGLLALLLGLTFGLPGFRLIALTPPFNMNANFKFYFSEIHACLALLAGVGLDLLWSGAKEHGDKIRAVVYPILITIVIIFLISFADNNVIFALLQKFFGDEFWLGMMALYLTGQFALIFLFIVFLQFKKTGLRKVVPSLLLFLIFYSLYANSQLIIPYIQLQGPKEEMRKQLDSLLAEASNREQRVDGLESFWPANRLVIYGFKDVRSSDALFYKPYVSLLNKINGLTAQESLGFFYPSYFTQPSSEKLLGEEAKKLSISLLLSNTKWIPAGIVDHIIYKEGGIYGVWPPSRNTVQMKYGEEEDWQPLQLTHLSWPCLFLHAPAVVSFHPARLAGASPGPKAALAVGTLSFIPRFQQVSLGTDGAIFQVIASDDSGPRLLYSLYINPHRPRRNVYCPDCCKPAPETPVVFKSPTSNSFSISTHPGPKGNRDGDWSAFMALSWNDGPFVPPLEPIWSGPDNQGPFIYKAPHLPWAHLEDEKELKVERTAGDEVAVEVSGAGGRLTVHEVWYPGWRVSIDGKDGMIEIPEDKVSWEVNVPEGAKEAVFRFEPYDFRIGLYGSLATALVFLLALVLKPQMNTDEHR